MSEHADNVHTARQLIADARRKARGVKGESVSAQSARCGYNGIAEGLAAAIRLSDGPDATRSAYWREKLAAEIADAVKRLAE